MGHGPAGPPSRSAPGGMNDAQVEVCPVANFGMVVFIFWNRYHSLLSTNIILGLKLIRQTHAAHLYYPRQALMKLPVLMQKENWMQFWYNAIFLRWHATMMMKVSYRAAGRNLVGENNPSFQATYKLLSAIIMKPFMPEQITQIYRFVLVTGVQINEKIRPMVTHHRICSFCYTTNTIRKPCYILLLTTLVAIHLLKCQFCTKRASFKLHAHNGTDLRAFLFDVPWVLPVSPSSRVSNVNLQSC